MRPATHFRLPGRLWTRSRIRLLSLGLLCATALVLVPAPGIAAAETYRRTDQLFFDARLQTRGYLPDLCLEADTACMSRAGNFRPEATAQAKVVQYLDFAHNEPRPAYSQISRWVHWEVAPNPDAIYAPDKDDPPDPPDLPEGSERWRIDVVDQRDPSGGEIFEVKRWTGPATQEKVTEQLRNYVARANQYDSRLKFVRSRRLAEALWSRTYSDRAGGIWCVWADPDKEAHPGNVYFARSTDTIPAEVRSRTPGCVAPDTGPAPFDSRPEIDPPVRILVGADCHGVWNVKVRLDPSAVTELVFHFGDSVATLTGQPEYERLRLNPGSGFLSPRFTHDFQPYDPGEYRQRVTVRKTGAFVEAMVIHPTDEGPPTTYRAAPLAPSQ